jgi:hypothetical protein
MKRKLSLLLLTFILGTILSPLSLAATSWDQYFCPISGGVSENALSLLSLEEEGAAAPEEVDEGADVDEILEEDEEEKLENGLTDIAISDLKEIEVLLAEQGLERDLCGLPNPITKSLEKGDCTAQGKIISEVTEIIGPAIAADEEGSEIKDVYKGVCCLVWDSNAGEYVGCREKRAIFTLDFETCDAVSPSCEKRQWIISRTGAGIIKIYVKQMYIWSAGIIGFIAVATIVVSGIQISVSGVSGDITAARERIIKALSGMVLLFLSGLILYTINPTFFS